MYCFWTNAYDYATKNFVTFIITLLSIKWKVFELLDETDPSFFVVDVRTGWRGLFNPLKSLTRKLLIGDILEDWCCKPGLTMDYSAKEEEEEVRQLYSNNPLIQFLYRWECYDRESSDNIKLA